MSSVPSQVEAPVRLLWVSAEPPLAEALKTLQVEFASGGQEALESLKGGGFDALLASFPLPEWTAGEFLEEVQRIDPEMPLLVRDPAGSLADAVRLTKLGAFHFFGETLESEELIAQIEAAAELRRQRESALFAAKQSGELWRRFLVGESKPMQSVCHIVRLIASKRCTVLVSGETGTGKEMVARALHMASTRSHLPMVAVNCSALPENLLEAELFGHVKGAFTGALNHRVGRFEQAHRSTLFLDEIGDLPLELQSKLLRVLQEREFQRIGSSETIHVDVRVVAASNADLTERVKEGRFREDLFYRLNVVPMRMPALRERWSDISILVHHFIDKICRLEEIPLKTIGRETLDKLCGFPWPGNVRQLENAVEMAIALSGDRQMLYTADFPLPASSECNLRCLSTSPVVAIPDDGLDFEQIVSRFERSILEQTLKKTSGNKKQAADMLRLKRTTLTAKLRSLQATA